MMNQSSSLPQQPKRLYVIIDESLSPVYGCVQGGHAVAQFLLDHPDSEWKNNYLIYLYGNVEKVRYRLRINDKDFSCFQEPDLGGKLTSIAVEDDGTMFRNYKLVA